MTEAPPRIVAGKIMPAVTGKERDPHDPPIFLLLASPTWAPWLPDTAFQKVPIGSSGQVLTVNADGSVGWANSSAGFTNPMSATGDLITSNPGSTPVALHIGAAGQVLLVSAGLPSWVTPPWMVNPMTTAQDVIVGGALGAPGRVGVGANGQVLTVTGGAVGWANSAAGFVNPMTTLGDVITGASGGAAQRLGVGTNGQVLTVAGGVPSWAASASGFANPMTTTGDLIQGGLGGAAARLPVGANGQVLTVVSGAPGWTSGSGGLSAVVFPSGDTTGVTDQANITAAYPAHGGEVLLANGAFYVKPPSGLNCLTPPVQTYVAPHGSLLGGQPVCLRGLGAATIIYPIGAGVTGIFYHRTTSYGAQFGLQAQPQTGYLRDFVIDGSLTTGAAIGLDWGDGWGYQLNLGVVNFDTSGAIGVQQINRVFWTEKNERISLRLANNDTAFYITTNLAPGGDHSSEYNIYDVSIFCNANQQGIVVDGVNMGGSYMWIRGNMSVSNGSGPAPPGNIAALSIINAAGVSGTDGHRWYAGGFYLKVEGNPGNGSGTTMPYCMFSDGVGYVRQCVFSVNGSSLTPSNWNGAEFTGTGNISADPGLLAAVTGGSVFGQGNATPTSLVVVGNVSALGSVLSVTNTGASPTGPPAIFQGANPGDHMLGVQVTGDSNPRWKVDTGGDVLWGSGSAVQDTDIKRTAVGTLTMSDGTNANNNVVLRIAGTVSTNQSALFIANGAQPPTPTGGGMLFVVAGALKYIGSSGTVTPIAPA